MLGTYGADEPAGGAIPVVYVSPDQGGAGQGAGARCPSAAVTQTCVVSLDDFNATVEEVFQARFVPSGDESDDIDPESEDELPFEGNLIDLGEAAAEQLALALDPYPRLPGVELPAAEDERIRIPLRRCDGSTDGAEAPAYSERPWERALALDPDQAKVAAAA